VAAGLGQAVPFVDLGRGHGALAEELRSAFDRVLRASAFVLGEEVEAFEEEFARYCGATHCVGVASGTVALELAVRAMGIGPGDEVIVPAHTFIASALGPLHAGATPVFCDVHADTALIDPDAVAAAITSRTAAILPVHLYGQVCDVPAVEVIAERHGLTVLEDAAQAHGATWQGRRAGSLGRAAAFSFYPSKNLGALGDAGAVVTDDAAVAEAVRRLRNLGQRAKGEHVDAGYNERLDGLQAAALRTKLPYLDDWNAARRRHAHRYREALEGSVELLGERPESESVHHLFPVRLEDRDDAARRLATQGIGTGVHYSPAVHRQPPFGALAAGGTFPAAEAWADEELSLPMFPEMRDAEVDRVAEAVGALPGMGGMRRG